MYKLLSILYAPCLLSASVSNEPTSISAFENRILLIMMLVQLLIIFSHISIGMSAAANISNAVFYRPSTHFTPAKNFMNDPNGLLYDDSSKTYHMYYQYNPVAAVAGNQHWGHATSPDLLHWDDQPIALSPTADGGLAFSGSMVNDLNNTSGLFPGKGEQNFVIIYTLAYPDVQKQAVSYSLDGGKTFIPYDKNPVLNLNYSQFRDPQVQWYVPESKWVMAVSLAREHIIRFYESKDLLTWKAMSDFQSGILGVDYECPNLVPVRDELNQTKWVLFISVNPGMPQGGSGTQYFIGNFNGTTFTPDSHATNMLDFAKDNYAMQYINPGRALTETDVDNSTYIGWFGNWQYCQGTPTEEWRSAMTFARRLSLKRDWLGVQKLSQEPVNIEALRIKSYQYESTTLNESHNIGDAFPLPTDSNALELILKTRIAPLSQDAGPGQSRFALEFFNDNQESLEIGIDPGSGQIWMDRSNLTGYSDPFFTGKFSTSVRQPVSDISWRVILDASLIELYADDGFAVGSAVYFPSEPLTHARVKMTSRGASESSITVYPLKKSMDRETLIDA